MTNTEATTEPTQHCDRCGIGPFFFVAERPYPTLCLDCAELETPSATTYRQRREAKAERLRGWAEKREAKADADYERASSMAGMIPFGQPILAGHYSEGRDRRYRDRISRTYERAFESADKAKRMNSHAATIDHQLETSIYSDDPDAVEALEARIANLEAERDRIKRYNASCRKGSPDLSVLDEKQQQDIASCIELQGWQCKGGAFPGYVLSNLSGNIKRNRDRLASLRNS